MNAIVSRYLDAAPAEHRACLDQLRIWMDKALPDATIVDPNGFPVYTMNDAWVMGFATRAKGPMLYIMQKGVLDQHESSLGPCRSGNSCVELRSRRGFSTDELMTLAQKLIQAAATACKDAG